MEGWAGNAPQGRGTPHGALPAGGGSMCGPLVDGRQDGAHQRRGKHAGVTHERGAPVEEQRGGAGEGCSSEMGGTRIPSKP